MPTKHYRLLQPLPGIPAGTEFEEFYPAFHGRPFLCVVSKGMEKPTLSEHLETVIEEMKIPALPLTWKNDPTWFEEIKPARWKPETDNKYFFLTTSLEAKEDSWVDYAEDNNRYNAQNCFPTLELAHSAALHLKKALDEWWEKNGGGV